MITPAPHQIEAVKKFVGLEYCFIGDSMGVGKTLTAVLLDRAERKIAWAEHDNAHRHFRTLIVCTKGGLSVWKWHLEDQGVPSDRIFVVDPRDRTPFDRELELGALNYDYYIMHYHALELLPSLNKVTIGRGGLVWDHIIADEVHYIKNRKAKRTAVLKKQKARKRTAISGTPADDKPQDIWSVLNWLDKRHYSSYWRFYNTYLKWEEKINHATGTGYRVVTGTKNMREYHQDVSGFYIRRTLPEVRGSMPEKTHGDIWVDLSDRQLRDYRQIEEFQTALLGRANEEFTILWEIAMWQRLQQMTLGTVIELDWSHYEAFWARHRDTDPEDLPKNPPTGPKFVLGEPSPKLDAVLEKISEAQDEGESIVVMTNYKEVVRMLEARCKKEKIPLSILHGGMTSQTRRDASVADFQSRKTNVFVGTIGAAGTSITLTAAHTMLFTDRHWNPSVNRQAEDRIWRFDQQNACQIWDVSARDTVDVSKRERITEKAKRVDAIVEVPDEFKRMGVFL
jgi:SNF2 family DNA or RNA helicase